MDATTVSTEDSNSLRREVDRLKADLHRLRLDFTDLGGDAMHAATAGATKARERVAETAHAAAAKGRDSVEAVEEQVAAHPFMSLATAFAVGMLLGLGICRKD